MAIIHDTTLSPGKVELLADWLPAQSWYAREGREPALSKAGGFRLDDPQGKVGIEFMVATDDGPDGSHARGILATAQAVQMPAAH